MINAQKEKRKLFEEMLFKKRKRNPEPNQWKVPAILLFYKKINSATWKEQKINFLHLFFIEQQAKLLPFLLMLVDQLKSQKKYLFRKKGRVF